MKTNSHFCFRNSFAFLILFFALALNLIAQPQYYNYNTNGTNNSFPLGISGGKDAQWLILAGELSSPTPAPSGNITKFWFRVGDTYPISNVTYTTFEIKLAQSSITGLPVGSFYTPMTTVFARASYLINAAGGTWYSVILDTPFPYDPSLSLIVEMGHCGAPAATGYPMCTTTLTGARRNYSLGGCPFVYSANSTSTINMGVDIGAVNCNYSWATQTSGVPTILLQAVWAPSESVCWIAGATSTVRKTTDGGTTWTNANPNPGVITGDIYNIWAADANNALLTTSPGATFIYRTTNGGTNWTQVFTQAGGFIDAIVMSNATTGYAYGDPVGARWSLWKTINSGATWDSAGMFLPQAGSEAGWNNSMCVIGNNIWFGTNNTKVYRSTNGGVTGSWTAGVTTGNVSTYGVWFTSATNGMCVGTIAQKTTDGGVTWVNGGTVGGSGNMTSVGGQGGNFWLTRGNNTYGTTDMGTTWTGTGYTGTTALWGTSITAATNGCLVGWSVGASGGTVKLTGSPVGIVNNNSEIPNEYRLAQNYPNPFNPTTNFIFALPQAGYVDLKVYDLLGREVANIVSEYKAAGSYTVEFNASSLSSGVYFYTLRASDFTETKKMVLIK